MRLIVLLLLTLCAHLSGAGTSLLTAASGSKTSVVRVASSKNFSALSSAATDYSIKSGGSSNERYAFFGVEVDDNEDEQPTVRKYTELVRFCISFFSSYLLNPAGNSPAGCCYSSQAFALSGPCLYISQRSLRI